MVHVLLVFACHVVAFVLAHELMSSGRAGEATTWSRLPKRSRLQYRSCDNPFEADAHAFEDENHSRRLAGCFSGAFDKVQRSAYWDPVAASMHDVLGDVTVDDGIPWNEVDSMLNLCGQVLEQLPVWPGGKQMDTWFKKRVRPVLHYPLPQLVVMYDVKQAGGHYVRSTNVDALQQHPHLIMLSQQRLVTFDFVQWLHRRSRIGGYPSDMLREIRMTYADNLILKARKTGASPEAMLIAVQVSPSIQAIGQMQDWTFACFTETLMSLAMLNKTLNVVYMFLVFLLVGSMRVQACPGSIVGVELSSMVGAGWSRGMHRCRIQDCQESGALDWEQLCAAFQSYIRQPRCPAFAVIFKCMYCSKRVRILKGNLHPRLEEP